MASGNNIGRRSGFWTAVANRLPRERIGSPRVSEDRRHRGIAVTLSVVISFVLWFSFTMTEEYTVAISLPTTVDLPPDAALTELPPRFINVELRGEGFQVFRLKYNPPTVHLAPGAGPITVTQAIPEMPQNVMVQSVTPPTIALELGEVARRMVPVRLNADIRPGDAYDFIDSLRVSPDSVLVSGAETVLNRLDSWPTEYFEYDDLKDTLVARVELADTLLGLVTRHADYVTVRAATAEFTVAERVLDVIPRVASMEPEVRLEPGTVLVRYRARFPDDYWRAQEAVDFYAEVPYDSIARARNGRVRPQIHVPPDLDIRDLTVEPPTVRFYWRQR